MSKSEKEKFIEFCGVLGFKVNDTQMKVFELYNQAKQENKEMFINLGRQQGRQYLNTILINFELWEKDHRIAELEKELQRFKCNGTPQEFKEAVLEQAEKNSENEKIEFAIKQINEVYSFGFEWQHNPGYDFKNFQDETMKLMRKLKNRIKK